MLWLLSTSLDAADNRVGWQWTACEERQTFMDIRYRSTTDAVIEIQVNDEVKYVCQRYCQSRCLTEVVYSSVNFVATDSTENNMWDWFDDPVANE